MRGKVDCLKRPAMHRAVCCGKMKNSTEIRRVVGRNCCNSIGHD